MPKVQMKKNPAPVTRLLRALNRSAGSGYYRYTGYTRPFYNFQGKSGITAHLKRSAFDFSKCKKG